MFAVEKLLCFFCYEYVLFECVIDRAEQTLLTDILLTRSCKAVVSHSMEHIMVSVYFSFGDNIVNC